MGIIPRWVIKNLTELGNCYIKNITFELEQLEKEMGQKVSMSFAHDEDAGFILKLEGERLCS